MSFRGLLNNGAVRGAYLNIDSLVVGRYFRDYGDLDTTGRGVDGHGALVGLGSLYDYDVRELPFAWDRTATVGILGPVAEIETRRGLVALRARLAVAYAFGQITSLAYARVKAAFDDVIIKSELKDHGYYYAQGIVYDGEAELEVGDFRLAFGGRGGTYWSFDSRDTNQSQIQNNFSLRDTRLFLRTAASLQPGGGPVRIAIELDDDIRESSIPGSGGLVRRAAAIGVDASGVLSPVALILLPSPARGDGRPRRDRCARSGARCSRDPSPRPRTAGQPRRDRSRSIRIQPSMADASPTRGELGNRSMNVARLALAVLRRPILA